MDCQRTRRKRLLDVPVRVTHRHTGVGEGVLDTAVAVPGFLAPSCFVGSQEGGGLQRQRCISREDSGPCLQLRCQSIVTLYFPPQGLSTFCSALASPGCEASCETRLFGEVAAVGLWFCQANLPWRTPEAGTSRLPSKEMASAFDRREGPLGAPSIAKPLASGQTTCIPEPYSPLRTRNSSPRLPGKRAVRCSIPDGLKYGSAELRGAVVVVDSAPTRQARAQACTSPLCGGEEGSGTAGTSGQRSIWLGLTRSLADALSAVCLSSRSPAPGASLPRFLSAVGGDWCAVAILCLDAAATALPCVG